MRQVKITSQEPWRRAFEKMALILLASIFFTAAAQLSSDKKSAGEFVFFIFGYLIVAFLASWPATVTTTINIEDDCIDALSIRE